jgi:hypothetical protein
VGADDPEPILIDVQALDIDLLIVLDQLKSIGEIRVVMLGEHPRGLRCEPRQRRQLVGAEPQMAVSIPGTGREVSAQALRVTRLAVEAQQDASVN